MTETPTLPNGYRAVLDREGDVWHRVAHADDLRSVLDGLRVAL